jgi:thiamine-phosphate pyrophosphorylase
MRGLYAIVDPEFCLRDPVLVTQSVLRGGCCALQLRDKRSDDAAFSVLGKTLSALCRAAAVPFIVNDRFWLARELAADGVHIGQSDAAIDVVRKELGARCSIGVSTHSLAQAQDAEQRGADLIGFGPVFETSSKQAADPVVGLVGLGAVCATIRIPVVAIGGLSLARARSVADAGASCGACIGALCAATDPEQMARALHAQLSRAKST